MKLLFIAPAFYPSVYYGGPIYSSYSLAKALKKTGIDVRVITTDSNGNVKLKIKTGTFHKLENDLPVKYYKSLDSRGTSLAMILNLRKEIKNSDIVYLVSIFSAPTPFTIFLCRLYKKPLIISPRGQLGKWCLEQGSIFKKLWLRLFIPQVSAKSKTKTEQPYIKKIDWHLASLPEEQAVLTVYPSAKTFVIPNGVSEELFSLDDKPKDRTFYKKFTGFDCSNKKIVVSMGRLHKVKGFDILISSMSKVRSRDVILLIAGEDFGERKTLEEMIDKLGLKEKVFLIGRIEGLEKIEFLRNADVFALASHHENFGMSYAEALAAGTPVIASRNTPWQDVEKHNCGKWVENTPEKFAQATTEILNSDTELMGKNGSNFIFEKYSTDKIAREFLLKLKDITMEYHD